MVMKMANNQIDKKVYYLALKQNENTGKKVYYSSLYDYYQKLLTEKQCNIFEDYYFNDYSLSEIADNLNVSRNAIWDILKKVEHNLEDYETKLELYKKSKVINQKLNELKEHVDQAGLEILQQVKEME